MALKRRLMSRHARRLSAMRSKRIGHRNGQDEAKFAAAEERSARRMHTPSDDPRGARAAEFRARRGIWSRTGPATPAAPKYFGRAKTPPAREWNLTNSAGLGLWKNPMKAGGPEFWNTVDSLGATGLLS